MSCRNGTWLYSDATPGSAVGRPPAERAARGPRLAGAEALDERGDVLGRRPAAAADQGQPELGGEPVVRVGELAGGQRVIGAVGGQFRQAGVRLAGDRDPRVRGEVPQVLAHLAGAGRAVQPDHVDAERLEGGQRRADLAAEQHGPGRLDGQLRDDERVGGERRDRSLRPDDRRLRLEQVRAGLDDQRVRAAAQQPGRVLVVGVAQLAEGDVAERRQFRARADRAEHPARAAVGRRARVRRLAGQPGAGLRQLGDPLGDAVLAQVAQVGPERVRRDAVGARVEVGVVHARTMSGRVTFSTSLQPS